MEDGGRRWAAAGEMADDLNIGHGAMLVLGACRTKWLGQLNHREPAEDEFFNLFK